jgi:hypothetical protein
MTVAYFQSISAYASQSKKTRWTALHHCGARCGHPFSEATAKTLMLIVTTEMKTLSRDG